MKTEKVLRAMLEKGPRGRARPASRTQRGSICRCWRQPLAAFSPSPAPMLTEAENSQKKVQKHGSYEVLNCHTVFTVGATIIKFGTHMDHG